MEIICLVAIVSQRCLLLLLTYFGVFDHPHMGQNKKTYEQVFQFHKIAKYQHR